MLVLNQATANMGAACPCSGKWKLYHNGIAAMALSNMDQCHMTRLATPASQRFGRLGICV